jgi:hypothetical protein
VRDRPPPNGRDASAELVTGKDPAEHQVGALGAEALRCQRTVGGTVAIQSRP